MVSLRAAARCLGKTGTFSILGDLYGYRSPPRTLSILTQLRLLQGSHIHLNLIRVGVETFSVADEQEIDAAVQTMRDLYAAVGIGIGRVERYGIPLASANGHENIDNDDEATALTDEWSVPNDGLDIFFVQTYAGTTVGRSRTHGPCDKNAKGMDSSVVAIEGTLTGFVLAHEAGHFLGLDEDSPDDNNHHPNSNNLMFASVPNGGQLTGGQGGVMKVHCWMRAACKL